MVKDILKVYNSKLCKKLMKQECTGIVTICALGYDTWLYQTKQFNLFFMQNKKDIEKAFTKKLKTYTSGDLNKWIIYDKKRRTGKTIAP